jgi:hypothetical protein
MRKTLAAAAALLAASCAGPALAQGNPLIGTWQHSEPGVYGGPATTMLVRFMPDQTFETRWAIPPTPQGGGSGFIVITGRYRMTGPNAYDSVADQAMMCPSGMSCGPVPPGAPSLGLGQTAHYSFEMSGPSRMTVNGMAWYRQE